MVKEIDLRGFMTEEKYNGITMRYRIDGNGIEEVFLNSEDFSFSITINIDNENLKLVYVMTRQYWGSLDIGIKFDIDINPPTSRKNAQINAQQAKAIYQEVKRLLKVEEKIKDYVPRFSSLLEINPYNILGINEVSELESLVKKE